MANTSAAKKAIRVSARKAKINDRMRKSYKSARKAVLDAVKAGKKKEAEKLMVNAYKQIDKASKKLIKKNTAARLKSRLVKKVKSM